MLPRCIDEWHGQLLCDAARLQQGAGSAHGQQAAGAGVGTGAGASRGGAPGVKQEPGLDRAEEHGAGGLAAGAGAGLWLGPGELTKSALAAMCWLRQPPGGRFWSTSALAAKRLGAAGAGQQPGPLESFDSVFLGPDAPIPGVRLCAGYQGDRTATDVVLGRPGLWVADFKPWLAG